MRLNNYKLGQIVYHDQFFEYFNQLRSALNIQPDDNAILRGLQLSQSGTNVNVSAGWATAKPVFISFIKNNLGDTIRPCEEAVATGIPLPDPFNGFVYLRFIMSSMVGGAAFYDITTQIVIATAPTAAFPTSNIIGEVCLGSVSRNGALITISNVGRDYDAAPSGDPVLANSYDASTDSPSLAGMSVPSFYRVGTAGTQVIGGVKYSLKVKDLVFRDSNGYSVVSATRNLNFQNIAYAASTDTPALADLLEGGIYEVIAAGKLTGVTILGGVMVGADSYLLVGDKVVNKNGSYELISPKIKNGTTINVGTGGLFTTFKDANDYVSQRVYTGVILNQLSNTAETASIDIQNPCGGRLVIMSNGFLIDFSGTLNLYCIVTGNNVFWDRFDIKLNLQRAISNGLIIKGELEYSNNCKVENINVTGDAMVVYGKLRNYTTGLLTLVAGFICGPTTLGGGSFYTKGGVTTVGGSYVGFYAGEAGSNYIGGAITTGGGSFDAGASCSNYFGGAIDTGGGQFYGGNATNNVFRQLVALGVGSLDFGFNTINVWFLGATGTGGVIANAGSQNNCNGQPMPAGTPASGTITAAFSRVS
mgnify:CR=1 FL=1